MYKFFHEAHSGLAYLVLLGLVISTIFYFLLFFNKTTLTKKSKTIALVTMIIVHLQFVLGLIVYFVSPIVQEGFKNFGESMGDSYARLRILEHPMVMLLVVILVTIAHKKVKTASLANRQLTFIPPLMFLLALLFALSRIPWDTWI